VVVGLSTVGKPR